MQACESFQASDIFEDEANLVKEKSIALLSDKEADKLRQSQRTLNDLVSSPEPLKYESKHAGQSDELWIKDTELKAQVAIHKVKQKK